MYNHVLLEVFCTKAINGPDDPIPSFCESNATNPGYYCLWNKCLYMTFTSCENTFCYVGEDSTAVNDVGFGGDMLPQKTDEDEKVLIEYWKEICLRKINEAFTEYRDGLTQHLL